MKKSTQFTPPHVFIHLIRVGVIVLCGLAALYIFWPAKLEEFAKLLPFRQSLIDVIKNYPGFDNDWLSMINLVVISFSIYAYLAVIFIVSYVYLTRDDADIQTDDTNHWVLLDSIVMGRSSASSKKSIYKFNPFSAKTKMTSFFITVLSASALTYIGRNALSRPPTNGGLFERVVDAGFVSFWCYCIFSIVIFALFSLISQLRNSHTFNLK